MLNLFRLSLRVLFLELVASLFLGALGFLLAGQRGSVAALGILALGSVFVAFGAEPLIVRAYSRRSKVPASLDKSLRRLGHFFSQGRYSPKVLIFADPSPNALIARSVASRGTVLLSQGLITLLDEKELTAVLSLCALRLAQPETLLQTTCSCLEVFLLKVAPAQWVAFLLSGRRLSLKECTQLGPISALRFLVLVPPLQVLTSIARFPGIPWNQDPGLPPGLAVHAHNAMHKIEQATQIWTNLENPGTRVLHLHRPRADRPLLQV